MIPQAAPFLRIERYRAEIGRAIDAVLSGRHYIMGPEVDKFENAFANYIGARHCIGVASGTDAISLALRAAGIGPGDEVIAPALTFSATAHAIRQCGAIPCFVDVDPVTRCMDPVATEAAVNERTAAILPVHLYGHPADMPRLVAIAQRHSLFVLEDCAQSHGAEIGGRKLGSFGDAAAFSFYPTKNLGCIGDGGAVVTSDGRIATGVRHLRQYGWEDSSRHSTRLGFNSRLDELQAAVLSVLLPHLDEANAERRGVARAYASGLRGLPVDLPPYDDGAVYHQFAVLCEGRDRLMQRLSDRGIGTAVHYSPGLHQHAAFATGKREQFPHTERLADRLISLPIQPEVVAQQVPRVCAAIAEAIG